MIELDTDSVVQYLVDLGLVGKNEPATASALGWGVSNVVLRIDTPDRSVVVKQSRGKLRTTQDWFSNLDRVFREAAVMRVLGRSLPSGVVPEILAEDQANFAIVMSAIPADHVVWKQALLNQEIDTKVARAAGGILGTIHCSTAGNKALAQAFSDIDVFIQLRVEPFYWRIRPRHPDLANAINAIVEEMFRTRVALTHADFSPKNLLVYSGGVALVDYETGHWGDPAFDLGFFLSHLILKAVKFDTIRSKYFDLTRAFWDSYRDRIRSVSAVESAFRLDLLTRRAIGHFALCLLARIDGTSPVDYLPDERKRDLVRAVSRELLRESHGCWEDALRTVDDAVGGADQLPLG
jgi:5-methylthioribose kinase